MKTILKALRAFLAGVVGWLVIGPVALAFPRRKDWLCVIGRDDGRFVDNAKYFYIESRPLLPRVRIEFLSERAELVTALTTLGEKAILFPSLDAWLFLLRCGTVVVDSNEWRNGLRRFLLLGARKFQIWHGVGFKRIEADKWRHEVRSHRWLSRGPMRAARRTWRVFTGREAPYDAVLATSRFYREHVFTTAFWTREVVIGGYPRNGFGRGAAPALVLLGSDPALLQLIEAWSASGRRVILVAPTFRDTRATPLGLTPDTISSLDAFAEEHGFEFVFKFHPHERGATHVAGTHIHIMSAEADVYPALPMTTALITDYSSIYMDYLWLDRPMLFLVPDLQEYVSRDREIQFDFAEMTPGPKLSTWPEVMNALSRLDASHADARARLRRLAFDNFDQARSSRKIAQHMLRHRWIEPAPAP